MTPSPSFAAPGWSAAILDAYLEASLIGATTTNPRRDEEWNETR